MRDLGYMDTVLSVSGDATTPLTVEAFENGVRNIMELAPEAPIPGFFRCASHVRQKQLTALTQQDEGAFVFWQGHG